MADQDQAVDTDCSGRPYRVPTAKESRGFPSCHNLRTTVSSLAGRAQGSILIDTLSGNWLPAWKLKRSTKQVAHVVGLTAVPPRSRVVV